MYLFISRIASYRQFISNILNPENYFILTIPCIPFWNFLTHFSSCSWFFIGHCCLLMCFHNFQILHNLSGAKKVEITFIKICPFSNLFVKISKGQLISKCLYNLIILTKLATKMLEGFLKDIFLEFPGSFLGLPVGFLIDDIMYIPKKPKKLPGSYKNFRAEILTIFSLLFWSKQ